jgi:hypothetical protein
MGLVSMFTILHTDDPVSPARIGTGRYSDVDQCTGGLIARGSPFELCLYTDDIAADIDWLCAAAVAAVGAGQQRRAS